MHQLIHHLINQQIFTLGRERLSDDQKHVSKSPSLHQKPFLVFFLQKQVSCLRKQENVFSEAALRCFLGGDKWVV